MIILTVLQKTPVLRHLESLDGVEKRNKYGLLIQTKPYSAWLRTNHFNDRINRLYPYKHYKLSLISRINAKVHLNYTKAGIGGHTIHLLSKTFLRQCAWSIARSCTRNTQFWYVILEVSLRIILQQHDLLFRNLTQSHKAEPRSAEFRLW